MIKGLRGIVAFVMFSWSGFAAAAPLNLVHQKEIDYDGDSVHDISLFDRTVPDAGTWYILQGGTKFTTAFSITWGRGTDEPVPGDYDNDGRIDIAVFRAAAAPAPSDVGTWYILQGGKNFTTAFAVAWGTAGSDPLAGDYDGDGKTDIAVFKNPFSLGLAAVPDAGRWYILQGGTNFTTAFSVQWGSAANPGGVISVLNPELARPADYDGDGRLDLCVYVASLKPDSGTWYIVQGGTNFTTAFAVARWGNGGFFDVPVPGDYDGDNKIDLAVFESFGPPAVPVATVGTWYVLQGGGKFTTAFQVKWGVSSADAQVAVPADYDNDGRLDMAVFAQIFNAPGTWYILQAGSNFTTAFKVVFGAPAGFVQQPLAARVHQGRYAGGIY